MFRANAIQILLVDKHSKRPLKAQLLPLDIDSKSCGSKAIFLFDASCMCLAVSQAGVLAVFF